jgi:hypothetical protein
MIRVKLEGFPKVPLGQVMICSREQQAAAMPCCHRLLKDGKKLAHNNKLHMKGQSAGQYHPMSPHTLRCGPSSLETSGILTRPASLV